MRAAIIVVLLFVAPVYADVATITVDLDARTTTPPNPIVNTGAGNAVVIQVVKAGKPLDQQELTFEVRGLPQQQLGSNKQFTATRVAPTGPASGANLIQFERCTRPERDPEKRTCPALYFEDRVWRAVVNDGVLQVTIVHGEETYSFPLQVVRREAALFWSGGVVVASLADEQYRLDPVTGDAQQLRIVQVGDDAANYKVAGFANYLGMFGPRWIGPAFGISTDVPVENVSLMLGITFSALTLPADNSGHLTIGGIYGRHQVLASSFEGREFVPVGTTPESLTVADEDLGWFVAFTFSFAGGEEKFAFLRSAK